MARKQTLAHPRRGEVYLVNFDPTIGSEIQKSRPAVVIQNDVANRWSPITIVAALTSRSDEELYPTEVPINPPEGGLTKPSAVLLNQVRSIDKRRLVRRFGMLRQETMMRIDQALRISLGLVEL